MLDLDDGMGLVAVALLIGFVSHEWLRRRTAADTSQPTTVASEEMYFSEPPQRRFVAGGGEEDTGWYPVRLMGPQVDVDTLTHPDQTIAALKQQVSEVAEGRRVTLILQGRRLEDASTIASLNIHANSVLHCVMATTSQVPPSSASSGFLPQAMPASPLLTPGYILALLGGGLLALFWLLWAVYGARLVNNASLLMLSVLTCIFGGLVFRMRAPEPAASGPSAVQPPAATTHDQGLQPDSSQGRNVAYLTPEEIARLTQR